MMDPVKKAAWLAALRSGEYQQATQALRVGDTFCCLGVLCDLAAKEGLGKWGVRQHGPAYVPGSVEFIVHEDGHPWLSTLPRLVADWAGLAWTSPAVKGIALADLNDRGTTFAEIADLIEQHL